jgi:ArsR family transcriptional regulator
MKIAKAVTILSALAQESRLSIYILLTQEADPKGLPAGVIAQRLAIPQATLSFHLSQLAHAGLVEAIKEGRSIFYSINQKKVKKLTRFLTKFKHADINITAQNSDISSAETDDMDDDDDGF